MNQQRARRFRGARDAQEADEKKAEFQTLLRQQSQKSVDDESTVNDIITKTWDSNVITPGTPFMFILAQSIRFWVQWKLNTDPGWANLKVLISDASVPGEGEHKIMQFIRSQRSDPEYNPNTSHVMYGLDADLIMLGLGTHEPNFRVLREDVFLNDAKAKVCRICGQKGHYADNCRGEIKEKKGDFDEKGSEPELKPFIWLNVPILREYLGAELFVPGQPFRFDLERALDDWVFMCFFVGNDFLPHLPSLDIHEDGIDKLIAIWRDNIPVMGSYLTCDGEVNLSGAQCILEGLAKQENAIFRRRKEVDDKRERNFKRRQQEDEARAQGRAAKRVRSEPDFTRAGRSDGRAPSAPINAIPVSSIDIQIDYNSIVNRGAIDRSGMSNQSAAAVLKAQMLAKQNGNSNATQANGDHNGVEPQTPLSAVGKRKAELMDEDSDMSTPGRTTPVETETPRRFGADPDNPPPDTVRLWEEGYADRYYEQKFHVAQNDIEFRHGVARAYVEGLAWVLLYYFQGCKSWTWYYPYHYAPFAADFVDLDKMKINFEKGAPFRPYEQLMGVFPAASRHAIPQVFHPLMTEDDSPIIDFYPIDFDLDLNGKKQSWKAVVLLPFIDEKRLLDAMNTKYPLLTDDERARNEVGKDALLVSDTHPMYDELTEHFYSKKSKQDGEAQKLPVRKFQLAGVVEKNMDFLPHMSLRGPEEDIKLDPEVDDDRSLSVLFTMPPATHVHKSMLLRGYKPRDPVLDNSDLAILKSKARNSGRDFGGAPLYDNSRRDQYDNHGRGGRINYAANRPPQGLNPDNPIAKYLPANFAPPPPSMAYGRAGPPAPPQMYQRNSPGGGPNAYGQNNYGRDQGYGYQGHQNGYQGYQNGYQGGYQGEQNHYQGGQQNSRGGQYRDQYPNNRSASDGHYQGQNGHYQGQSRGNGGYERR